MTTETLIATQLKLAYKNTSSSPSLTEALTTDIRDNHYKISTLATKCPLTKKSEKTRYRPNALILRSDIPEQEGFVTSRCYTCQISAGCEAHNNIKGFMGDGFPENRTELFDKRRELQEREP